MAKTRRLMKSNLPYVDIVVELRDAKIPQSSGNPELPQLIGSKKRVVLLNKCDNRRPRDDGPLVTVVQAAGDCRHRRRLQVGQGTERLFAAGAGRALRAARPPGGEGGVRPPDPDDGCRDPERRQILLYQPDGRQPPGQGGGPPRRHKGQAVGQRQQGRRTAGYARCPLAEV